ncbi:ABC transporter ATP-binding protein [Sinirhodobacter huangdaonensis]|uniref:ABC transporter ATP-binding protein n=1 Tax=Paenirhodobacter huangdaonensis TaxID=2501515 RepID=A0A3S3LGR9_9RHOB|nr:ABC transporter ATP-binding protein [Sinirhodobacter huangdaonensis]RWR54548.1 ABC transporter ATP-binding protein [Sinirhodobacter huangdaonensis]
MSELLVLDDLRAGYGAAVVIPGLSMSLAEGEALAVLGRNGVGKTTLLDSIIGVTRHRGGSLRLAGRELAGLSPERRAAAGIGWVPQERNIFRSLTVEENLTATARRGRWDLAAVYALFPRLQERRRNMGNQLSGGEQQMLAVGRALMLNPKVLLLDEPTEGLAPIIIEQLLAAIRRINREEGIATIIVEQHARKVLRVTDRALILDRGTIVHAATSAALLTDPAALEAHLGVVERRAAPA